MDRDRLAEVCSSLPIFPLGDAVLLPGAVLPLHVFEERYRQLLDDVVAGTGVMGIATVTEPSGSDIPDPVHPWVGVGMVVAHQKLPDGRSNILVQQVGVVRIVEELPSDTLYRRVRGEIIDMDQTDVGPAAQRLKVMMLQLGAMHPTAAEEASKLVELKGTDFLDGLARRVLPDVHQRLDYLGAPSALERVAILEDALAAYLTVVAEALEA